MALAITVESIETVAEPLRDEYVPLEGGKGFILKAVKEAGYESPDQVKGLKTALQKERENVGSANKNLQTLKEQLGDITPEQITELRTAAAAAQEAEARKNGEWDKLKAQMVDANTKALADKDGTINTLRAQLSEQLIDAEATRVLAEEQGNSTLLMPHVKSQTRVTEVNGKPVVQVVDPQGNPRVDGQGNPLTIKALVQEMRTKDVYAGAFAGTGNSGGGGGTGGAGGGTGGGGSGSAAPTNRSKMSVAEKAAFIGKNGTEAYMKLPA